MYTKEGIPIVTPDTAREMANELMTGNRRLEKQWLEDIMAENPAVAQFITNQAMRYKNDPKEVRRIADNMVYLYRLLKVQGENNKLMEMLERQGGQLK